LLILERIWCNISPVKFQTTCSTNQQVAVENGSYRTVSEFILESARRHLEALDK